MPNWCENSVTIYGSKEKIAELRSVIKNYKHGETVGFLGYCVPEPDYTVTPVAKTFPFISAAHAKTEEEKEIALKNEPTIREDAWWDWRVQKWGTKWEVDIDCVEINGEDYISMSFLSAWSPPIEAYKALLKHEGITGIQANYIEPGADFVGIFVDGKDTCFIMSEITLEDFKNNEIIQQLDDELKLYSEIMQFNPLQLRPDFEPVLKGLDMDGCWDVDPEIIEAIMEALKGEVILEGSIKLLIRDNQQYFTFKDKEYLL